VLRRIVREPVRDVDFGARLETFFVAAVATVLVIRTQLWLTNYPQLGGHGLHIAHLLYGGIFMVLAIGLLLTLPVDPHAGGDRRRRRVRLLHRRARQVHHLGQQLLLRARRGADLPRLRRALPHHPRAAAAAWAHAGGVGGERRGAARLGRDG
jgi:hypothetical protein